MGVFGLDDDGVEELEDTGVFEDSVDAHFFLGGFARGGVGDGRQLARGDAVGVDVDRAEDAAGAHETRMRPWEWEWEWDVRGEPATADLLHQRVAC